MELDTLKLLSRHAGGSFLPVLATVCVYATESGNRAQVGNGRYVVDVPTALVPMTINVERFVAAASACGRMPDVSVGAAFVSVSAGRVRARIQVDPTAYPVAKPDPRTAVAVPGVGEVLRILQPFVATDASKPWATSVCLSGDHAYATNNVVLVRHPLAAPVDHPVCIPIAAIEAITERGPVVDVGLTENAVTFYYGDDSWVKTQLMSGDWPTHTVDGYLKGLDDGVWETVNQSLGDMLTTAARMGTDRNPVVQFGNGGLALVDQTFEADELDPVPDAGKVSARMAALVFAVADRVQWHTPRTDVHAFRAGELCGVFGGTR